MKVGTKRLEGYAPLNTGWAYGY